MNAITPLNFHSLYEQLLALPEGITGELIDGELYTQPRPSGRHGVTEGALNIRIGGPFQFGDRAGRAVGGFCPSRKFIWSGIPR